VLVTGPGPGYVPLLEMTADQVRHEVGDHLVLALEVARTAAGFVDTPLAASYFSPEGLEARREELRRTLPIGRVVGPADVAALAVHIMANTALTGATYDIDGGQQFVA
jgi:NAD(P)-dependent dehydrogenase (short-subunit alcohol dehydrogenase family)